MATKKTTAKPAATQVKEAQETVVIDAPVKQAPIAPKWEQKNRTYILKHGKSPLTHTIPSKHTSKYSLLYFDKEEGVQKELRYKRVILRL